MAFKNQDVQKFFETITKVEITGGLTVNGEFFWN